MPEKDSENYFNDIEMIKTIVNDLNITMLYEDVYNQTYKAERKIHFKGKAS